MEKRSFMPPRMPGDFERLLWDNAPHELRGRVVSLEELKSLFPKTGNFSEISVIEEKKEYKIYGRRYSERFPSRIAYECRKCHSIIIGMPHMEEENSIGEMPLTGREGYTLYCQKCNNFLDDVTIKAS